MRGGRGREVKTGRETGMQFEYLAGRECGDELTSRDFVSWAAG